MTYMINCDRCSKSISFGNTRLRSKRKTYVFCPYCRHKMFVNKDTMGVRKL